MSSEDTRIQPVPEETGGITALQIAQGLSDIYDGFTESIRSMGSKANGKKGRSRFGLSALQWITGGHIKTERDVLCERFVQDVQKQLQTLDYALEGLPEEEAEEACAQAAMILSQPVPGDSNSTTVLMKRAMLSQVFPYLPRLSRPHLEIIRDRIEEAYRKSQRLPVETQVLKTIRGLLS